MGDMSDFINDEGEDEFADERNGDNPLPWSRGATHHCLRCLCNVLPILKEYGVTGGMQLSCPNCGAYGPRLNLLKRKNV